MGNIYLIDCAPGKVSQQWDAMADGRIALKPSSPGKKGLARYMFRD
jgi:hypothetical protein